MTRTIVVNVTCRVAVEVPEDSPLLSCDADRLSELTSWKANEHSDGRYPYGAELIHDGASRVVERGLYEALFAHHTARFGLDGGVQPSQYPLLTKRNAAVDRDLAAAHVRARQDQEGAGPLFVTVVHEVPR